MFRRTLLIFLAIYIVALPSSWAQAETSTSTVLHQWLLAFNSGDQTRLLAFWKKYGSGEPESQVSRDQGLHDMTDGFTVLKIVQDTGSHLVVSLKDGRGGYAEIILELASTDPPIIKSIVGHPVPPPASERSPSANDDELIAEVKTRASDLASRDQFSGSVLVAQEGESLHIFDNAWGLADREKDVRNGVETQFCIGSMNKMFTAVAVLQLVETGKLSLDATIAQYWPSYPNHDLSSKVTIRELLSHTGGTGDIFTPEYDAHRLEMKTLDDYVKLFGKRDLRFQPGSKFEYSNYGFILLGRLIEIVSGGSYDSYVQKHIYGPAGMTHTSSRPAVEQAPARALGYTRGPGGLKANTETLPPIGTPAGGGYSTVTDLWQFARALQAGKMLDKALVKQATSDQSGTGYGFGFNISKDGGFGHGGGAPGVNGELRIFPGRYVVVVLANMDPPSATTMANFIEAKLPLK